MDLLVIGATVFVRTAIWHYIGRIDYVDPAWIRLCAASWVADSGRWGQALRDGTLREVEPFCDPVMISRAAVCDVTPWRHALPREAK